MGSGRSVTLAWVIVAGLAASGGCVLISGVDQLTQVGGPDAGRPDGAGSSDTGQRTDGAHAAEGGRPSGGDASRDSGPQPPPPSCASGGAGMTTCGPGGKGTGSCCTSLDVDGGTFYRSYDAVTYTDEGYPATVSSFRLDQYDVTVGRFRKFVDYLVGAGSPPANGSGKHTHLNGGKGLVATGGGYEAGWDATAWDSLIATTSSAWNTNLTCSEQNWTSAAGANENTPINCETWFEAYAFCIWDGGFLPSEAEWNYAAAGGGGTSGQRAYPWSVPSESMTIDCSYGNYEGIEAGAGCVAGAINVGSYSPKGDGPFGHADMAGNVYVWTLDWYAEDYVNPCTDCANLTPATAREVRAGCFVSGANHLLASYRGDSFPPANRYNYMGIRCARAP
jgi:formylglycine-generating enzyme